MVEENRCQSRNDLLDDIKCGSRLLEQQLSRFKNWIGDRKVVSFIEMHQTKKLQKVRPSPFQKPLANRAQQPDGTWARAGENITVVSQDSALLELPSNVEERMAVEGNHSTMVKFSTRNNANYTKALGFLHRFEKEAKAVVERQFCSGT